MKLYTIYDNNGKVIGCEPQETQPANSTELMCTENFVSAYFDGNVFYEGASKEEISEYNDNLRANYSKRISNITGLQEAVERFTFDGTPIPSNIVYERERLKAEYNNEIK